MPYFSAADDVRLYYEDFGDGPAVVFTPAGNLTHRMWEAQVAGLAGRYRTIAYDWRGTGNSDRPRRGYTLDAVVGDLCRLVEGLKLEPAVLVGHGIGSHVTLLAALARPDLAAGIVVASAAPWFAGERDGIAGGLSQGFLDFLARGNAQGDARGIPYPAACAEMAEEWLFHRPQHPAVQQCILEQALSWPQHVINEYARSLRDIDHRPRLRDLACPALIVQGRHDRKQRYEGAAYLARHIAGAAFVTLEDSAHMGQIEEIAAFNRALRGFLDTTMARPRAA